MFVHLCCTFPSVFQGGADVLPGENAAQAGHSWSGTKQVQLLWLQSVSRGYSHPNLQLTYLDQAGIRHLGLGRAAEWASNTVAEMIKMCYLTTARDKKMSKCQC